MHADMSRHYGIVSKLSSLLGALILSTEEDHAHNTHDYPHTVINYRGWSSLLFVRLNPGSRYVEHVLKKAGFNVPGTVFADTSANAPVTFKRCPSA